MLLGEPGSGKSSVLEIEAARTGTSALTVRRLMNGDRPSGPRLFLDALDEYRIDGQDADKIERLSQVILDANVSEWRLTCRAEDWRKGSDLLALKRCAPGGGIVVAKLLPLDVGESAELLSAFGDPDPHQFLARANMLGVRALLTSPLTLKLLHRVVTREGSWPHSRYELFESAVTSLAYEHNDKYKFRERTAPAEIISAAEISCLIFLVCGARAIWRSNGEPPRSADEDRRAYLSSHDLALEQQVVADMLDTALFTGEGEEFEPLHRSIAEFLAGRALARIVSGSASKAAFPFERATALITGIDGAPPSELRGAYAWFAAHLSRANRSAESLRLIDADAESILFYGDAAAFATEERRAILGRLGRDDPYFRASESPDSAIAGLAQSDVAAELGHMLQDPANSDNWHRRSVAFDVLKVGRPIPELRALLREIAIDPRRMEWDRARAMDAYLIHPESSARELFETLEKEPHSLPRALLRLHLAAHFAADLRTDEIRVLLADFEGTPNDNTVGRLSELIEALSARSIDGLFDVPIESWLPRTSNRWRHDVEIEGALESMLISSIEKELDLQAERLWSWINNLRGSIWSSVSDDLRGSVRRWLDANGSRENDLFEVVRIHPDVQERPWQPLNAFLALTHRYPSPALIRSLLTRASLVSTAEGEWLRAIAVEIAGGCNDPDLIADVERELTTAGALDLVQRLGSLRANKLQQLEGEESTTSRSEDDTIAAQGNNVRVLTPVVDELRVGRQAHHLSWAANIYLSRTGMAKGDDGNLARLTALTDSTTLTAILAGWDYLATADLIDTDAVQLAALEAQNRQRHVEIAAFAGLHRRLKNGNPPQVASTPIVNALVAMRSRARLRDPAVARRLHEWALDRLNHDAALGARELLAYWSAAADHDATMVEPLWQFGESTTRSPAVASAIEQLLESRPGMHPRMLEGALRAALAHLEVASLRALCMKALATVAPGTIQHRIWSFSALALDPISQRTRFLAEHRNDADKLFTDGLNSHTVSAFRAVRGISAEAIVEREAALVSLLGPHTTPNDESDDWHAPSQQVIRGAINLLSNTLASNTGRLITQLAGDPALASWSSSLRHARASWMAKRRETLFQHPPVRHVQAALNGGPPVSGADLLAVVWQELENLRIELRSSENSPWKDYWNIDPFGRTINPVVENECRNRLLERLKDRLKPYNVAAVLPEAQRRQGTRADMLALSHAGRSLPVEVKRHYHADVWTAIGDQLVTYMHTHAADGAGIYLVFWFGNDVQQAPGRADGRRADTAESFAELLRSDMVREVAGVVRVVVFDVSRPSNQLQ